MEIDFFALAKVAMSGAAGAVALQLWKKLVKPAFEQYFQEPLKLHREWSGTIHWTEPGDHDIYMNIKKVGFSVSGTLLFTSGKYKGRKYKLTGRFAHLTLTFTYEPVNREQISQGSGTFLLREETDQLIGYIAYHARTDNVIETVPCRFTSLLALDARPTPIPPRPAPPSTTA
jgi:hypothetical protein